MANKKKEEILKNKRQNVILKVQPQELNLTDIKELLEKSKPTKAKKDLKGSIIGFIIIILGVAALILSLIVNELGYYEYFSDVSLIFNIGVSLFAILFGSFILIRETR